MQQVTADLLHDGNTSRIALVTFNIQSGSALLPGTRWVYLCVPKISKHQWHPFSLIQVGDQAHVIVKGVGEWSKSLCAAASSGFPLQMDIEGPFGRPSHAREPS